MMCYIIFCATDLLWTVVFSSSSQTYGQVKAGSHSGYLDMKSHVYLSTVPYVSHLTYRGTRCLTSDTVLHAGLAAVIETQQTVMAAVGEEALLNCQLMQPKDVLQVTWQKILPEGVKNIATYTEYFGVDEESGSVNSDLNVTLITVLVVVSCVCVAATVIIIILLIRKHQNRDSEENRTPRRTTKDTQPKTPLLIQENEVRQQMSPGKNKENGSPKE
uniref:uncharacterized protein LOC117250360 isoform X2 n=1 Tax=Epinephelus lanceolatus TaxID=310571 RepID=UPI001446FA75|nr:uncharacterized protein LOC117250360 isoform X2 [Epinephelus lanceolatus]